MTYKTKLSFRAKKLPKGFKSEVVKILPKLESIERKNEGMSYTTVEKLMVETTLEELEVIKKLQAMSKERNITMAYMIEDDETFVFQSNASGTVFPYLKLKGKDNTKYYKDEYELAIEFIDKYEAKFNEETAKLAKTLEEIYRCSPIEIANDIFMEDVIESWNRQENVIKEKLQFDLSYCEHKEIEEL